MNVDVLQEALASTSRSLPSCKPSWAFIMGSGWSDAAADFDVQATVPYSAIPHLGTPGTAGHRGSLLLASHCGHEILLFLGRRHYYEGVGWEPVALPVYLALELGVERMVLTNAAGGIREDLAPGTLMAIDDHINAIGSNPLIGDSSGLWGPRFADQTEVYDSGLRLALDRAAAKQGISLAHGVYAASCGPPYETPAEVRALRAQGADAVGMSTVPEALLASAAGMRVAGVSCISNFAAGVGDARLTHDDVVRTAAEALPRMRALLTGLLENQCPGMPVK